MRLHFRQFKDWHAFAFSMGLHLIALTFLPALLMHLSVMKLPDKKPTIVHFVDVPPKPKVEPPLIKEEIKVPEPKPATVSKPAPQIASAPVQTVTSTPASSASAVSPSSEMVASVSNTASWPVTARPFARPAEAVTGDVSHVNTASDLKQISSVGSREFFAAKPREAPAIEDLHGVEDGFAMLVREKIAAAKAYPASARARGFEGKVLISFTLNKNGRILDLAVHTSCGHALLDDAAVQAVRNASPFPPIPEKLGRESIAFNLPISFTLR